jgi:hypothetical protein
LLVPFIRSPKEISMLLTPLPGARDILLDKLQQIRTALGNARTSHTNVTSKHRAYLDAIAEASRQLRGQIRPADIDELLHTHRYWTLVQMTMPDRPEPVISDLLDIELDDRLFELDATIATTREAFNRWGTNAGRLVLPDTNFYLRHPRVLKNIDFHKLLDTDDTITVLFPLVVLEELDHAKRRNDSGRDKALVALAVLEAHAKDGLSGKWKDAPHGAPTGRGEIWFDVVLDPPGHVPHPKPDPELVGRAVAIEALAGRNLTFLTFDTHQRSRARGAGLQDVRKLDELKTDDD